MTHSTGGPVVRYYGTELGDDDKFNTVIFVAAPHQGSTKAYSVWEGIDPPTTPGLTGRIQDWVLIGMVKTLAKKAGCYHAYGILKSYQWVTNEDLYRYVQGQPCITYYQWVGIDIASDPIPQPGIPLLHDLLPSEGAREKFPYLHQGDTALQTFGPTSPTLNTINSPVNLNKFIDAMTDHDGALYSVYSLDKRTDITKTVKWYEIETDSSVVPLWMGGQAKPVGWPANQDGYVLAQGTDPDPVWGDGTVSAYSGDLKQLVNDSRIHSIPMTEEGVGHGEFFNRKDTLLKIIAPLLDPKNPALVEATIPYIAPGLPNPGESLRRAVWWNECPVTMLITDPQGRRIGTTPDGQEVNEIPGGYYSGHSTDNEPDLITFPEPISGVYAVTITGVATDTFTIRGDVMSSSGTTRLGRFSGSLQPGQVVTYTTVPFTPNAAPHLLLVDDHAGAAVANIYRNSLAQLGRTADVWDVASQGLPDLNTLYPYDTTIWATGTAGTLNLTTSLTLEAYTYNGGTVLLSGQNADSGISNSTILSETLHARLIDPSVDGRTLQGQELLAGLILHLNGGDGVNNQDAPSAIAALRDAVPLATYTDGSGAGQAAGLMYGTRDGRMVYLSFGVEGLQTATERVTVLDRLLRWLETGETPSTLPPTGTATPTSTPTSTPTATPTNAPTATSWPTSTPTATSWSTSTPTASPTSVSTATNTPTPTSTSGASSLTFAPEADARVKAANPTNNYGTSTYLDVDNPGTSDAAESYLRFTVSGVSSSIQHATLRLYTTTNGTTNGPAIYASNTSWIETGITWDTRPARIGGALDNKDAIGVSSWIEYDVTALVTGNGAYSFAVIGDSDDGVTFSSREGSDAPQLVLTLAGSGAATATPTSTPIGGTRLKTITFENGSLTHTTSGADSIVGTVNLETSTPLIGSYSGRIPNIANSYLREDFSPASDLYVSFYLRVDALPSSATRIAVISNSGTTVGELVLTTAGKLRLRNNGTMIGADSAALSVGTLYRVGLHQKQGSGTDAVLEAYLANGNTAFGTAFASSIIQTFTTPATRLNIGATTSTTPAAITIDDIKLDSGMMPAP